MADNKPETLRDFAARSGSDALNETVRILDANGDAWYFLFGSTRFIDWRKPREPTEDDKALHRALKHHRP